MATATKTPRKRGRKARTTKPAARIDTVDPASPFKRRLLSGSYESGLPFGIHDNLLLCDIDGPRFNFTQFEWSEKNTRLADAALRTGCKISISVSPEHALYAALFVSQRLKRTVFGGYDPEYEQLVLWDMNEDAEPVCDCCGD